MRARIYFPAGLFLKLFLRWINADFCTFSSESRLTTDVAMIWFAKFVSFFTSTVSFMDFLFSSWFSTLLYFAGLVFSWFIKSTVCSMSAFVSVSTWNCSAYNFSFSRESILASNLAILASIAYIWSRYVFISPLKTLSCACAKEDTKIESTKSVVVL